MCGSQSCTSQQYVDCNTCRGSVARSVQGVWGMLEHCLTVVLSVSPRLSLSLCLSHSLSLSPGPASATACARVVASVPAPKPCAHHPAQKPHTVGGEVNRRSRPEARLQISSKSGGNFLTAFNQLN